MTNSKQLRLYEEILLLALDDHKGTTGLESWFKTEMGGAILAELDMTGAVTIADDKKKLVAPVPGRSQPADPILAEALGKIMAAKKPKAAKDWVRKFSGLKDLKNRTAQQLVIKGVLKEETGKVLGIFSRTIFPEANPGPEQELRSRLETAIFTDAEEVDAGTVVIIALAKATGQLNKVFAKKRLKERKQRIEDLANSHLVGKATQETVDAIRTAVMVATTTTY